MKAVGFYQAGGPEVLDVIDLPDARPGDGELLIRVAAAAVNPTDAVRRAASREAAADAAQVPGMDAAGVLEEVGANARTTLREGDHVMAIVVPNGSHGAYAEKIAVPADSVVAAPAGSSHVEASTLPMNALTARMALDTLGLEPGGVLAVTGAAGALGGYTIQLAKADGLMVIADAADKDEGLVAGLGAAEVLPRGDDFPQRVRERYPDGVDGALDGAVTEGALAVAVKDGGTVITIRGYDEPGERGVTFQPILVVDYAREQAKLDTLRQQAEEGTLTLRVAETLPKEEAPQAHRRLEAGGVRGRLVLEL